MDEVPSSPPHVAFFGVLKRTAPSVNTTEITQASLFFLLYIQRKLYNFRNCIIQVKIDGEKASNVGKAATERRFFDFSCQKTPKLRRKLAVTNYPVVSTVFADGHVSLSST